MDTQVRNAKAVVDIDEVHFLEHTAGEPVIDDTLLGTIGATDDGWFSTTTLKGSVEVTQDALSLTKINIDQSNMPIGISTEPGDFNLSFKMPSWVDADLSKWLSKSSTKLTWTAGGVEGYGYDFNAELKQVVLAIKAKTGEWFIFPHVQGSVAMQQEDKTFVLGFQGMVLGATNPANNDVYILSAAASAGE
jgi:hypothetical protein